MKHFTTALLTLALFTGLSAGKSSAQGFRPVPSPVVWLADDPVDEIGSSNFDIGCNQVTCYPEIDITNFAGCLPGDIDGLIAIIAIAAKEVGFTDACDYICLRGEKVSIKDVNCPQLGGQEGEDIVDLWFELVDAGYTEDEAFDLIELVMGDHNALGLVVGERGEESIRTEQPEYLDGNQRSHLTPEEAFPF